MKIFIAIIIGFTIHMLYLDSILIVQHQIIDLCDINEKPEKDGTLPCLKYGNETANRFYFKYFGIYSLIPWKNIVTGGWRLE